MSDSKIEWTDKTWEVTAGCSRVSEGCRNCYAEQLVGTRFYGMAQTRERDGAANGSPLDMSLKVINQDTKKWNGHIELLAMNLEQPLKKKNPTVYFVNSRSDLFHPDVPFEYIDRVFAVMALCPQHRFQVLTKRPGKMAEYFNDSGSIGHRIYQQVSAWLDEGAEGFLGSRGWDHAHDLAGRSCSGSTHDMTAWNAPLSNVWLGTSVEDQTTADERIHHVLKCPGQLFLSVEPLLGNVNLKLPNRRGHGHAISWVITGGESGAIDDVRTCQLEWFRSIRDQCKSAGVSFFMKQVGVMCHDCTIDGWDAPCANNKIGTGKGGDPSEWPADIRIRQVPDGLLIHGDDDE